METQGKRLFFFDQRHVESCSGLHLASTPVEKHGIIMDQEGASDFGSVSVFAGSVVPLDDGGFRMYYYTSQMGPTVMRIAIAESTDGLQWTRRVLEQTTWEGEPCNHIRIEGLRADANITQPSVVRLPDGRWRMYCWLHDSEHGMIRYLISDSEDGLKWTLHDLNEPAIFHPADLEVGQAGWVVGLTQANPNAKFDHLRTLEFLEAKRLRSNDATNVYYDADTGLFEMYSVWLFPNAKDSGQYTPHDNAPGVRRVIHRRVSEDGLRWGDPELVLTPDAADPLTQQFYYLSQHREADWRVGFLGNYNCWDQTMDLELCFSRDGRDWDRPLRGGFIPRDPVPAPDCMSVYATNSLLPVAGDRYLMLYRGGNEHHNHTLPEGVDRPWRGTMGASWKRGRFAGLQTTSRAPGLLLTKPFLQTGKYLSIDARIDGSVRAELRDPVSGKALEGFELHNSTIGLGDAGGIPLIWAGGQTSERLRYDAVTLYLELHDSIIYSINS